MFTAPIDSLSPADAPALHALEEGDRVAYVMTDRGFVKSWRGATVLRVEGDLIHIRPDHSAMREDDSLEIGSDDTAILYNERVAPERQRDAGTVARYYAEIVRTALRMGDPASEDTIQYAFGVTPVPAGISNASLADPEIHAVRSIVLAVLANIPTV